MFSKNAKWISSTDIIVGRGDKYPFNGAYEFRRVFDIKEVKDTKILISGLGFYVLYINGKRVNDDVLNPAYTSYDKTVYYVEYDVTKFLVTGKNPELPEGIKPEIVNLIREINYLPEKDKEFVKEMVKRLRLSLDKK